MNLDSQMGKLGDDVCVRMPVSIVLAGADDRIAGADGGEELREGRRAAVVRDLQDAGAQQVGTPEQLALSGDLHVTGQEHRSCVIGDPKHQRHVVELAVGPPERAARLRAEDLDDEPADPGLLTRNRLVDRDATIRRGAAHVMVVLVTVGHGAVPDGMYTHVVQDVLEATDVILVRMAEDQEVDRDPTAAQPPRRGIVLADVDEHTRSPAFDQDGIALTDVDRGDRQDLGHIPGDRDDAGHDDREREKAGRPAHAPRTR